MINYPSVILITAILLVLMGVIILMAILKEKKIIQKQIDAQQLEIDHQKRMLKAALEAQENDRRKMAKELQDDIGMMLMTLRVNLNNLGNGPLQELRHLVDKTHESIRKMTWDLMPTTMEDFGVIQSTQEMCDRLSSTTIKVLFHESGDRISLDKDQELLLYRITQEAITNAIKHSNASSIDVHYQWNKQSLTLLIMDDGLGFDFPTVNNQLVGRHGLGLYNMENRVDLLGGELSFNNNNPSGTVVSVKLPLAS